MASSSGERKMLLLRSSDQEMFQVEESVAGLSLTIKHMMEDGRGSDPIPLPSVDGKSLAKVLEYCNKHGSAEGERMAEQDLKEWEKDFVNVDHAPRTGAAIAFSCEPRHFLDACSLCRAPLRGRDIYMYKGDMPFCSVGCRQQQIELDEAMEREASSRRRRWKTLAANFLEIKGLLDLLCQTVADMVFGKTAEQIREIFNIKNDFTPEEVEEIRKDNQWFLIMLACRGLWK